MDTTTTTDDSNSATKGSMPATENIPEIPQYPVYVTHEMTDEVDVRYVTSEHERIRNLEFDHLIVRCSICGHEAVGMGLMRGTAFEDQNMHFASRHRGSKTVWHPEMIPDRDAALDRSHVLRETSATSDEENGWDQYAFRARGDCSDENAAEIAMNNMDDQLSSVLIEHRPPTEPYEGGPETGVERELREVSVP